MRRLLFFFLSLGILGATAQRLPSRGPQDEERVREIMEMLRDAGGSLGDKIVMAAEALEGAGEDDYYHTDSIGTLRLNLSSFSPLMFVNNVVALAKASGSPINADLSAFESVFENISCRRGTDSGFPSIMYHSSDWIGDNMSRGNLTELTEDYTGVVARTKSLDEMTRKRNDFAALADSSVFETVRMTEMGFRTHRIPSLKKETIKKKEVIQDLRNGDIVLMVPNRDGIDLYDIGIVSMENGVPYLIHFSPQQHKIVKENDDLARYFSLMTKYFQGYRILRVKN